MTGASAVRPEWARRVAEKAAAGGAISSASVLGPDAGSARPSAVLVLLGDGATGPDVVLLERASTLRRHAGQVAFPGGAADPDDADPTATALREAQEEIGLRPGSVDVLATLPAFHIRWSGYMVTPVLGYWREQHVVGVMDVGEVAAVHRIALADLADPPARFTVGLDSGHSGPAFDVDGLFIWGFTAMVLDHVLRLAGRARPWNVALQRPIPAALRGRGPADAGSTP